MARVTRLVYQKRNKNLVNIHLDDEYAFSLSSIIAAELRLGQELDQDQIKKLHQRDSFERGKQIAIRYVSFRPRSATEVRRHLASKGLDESACGRVVERLEELKLLDDMAFARYWVEQRETFRPRSKRALAYELFQKGVDRAAIDEAIATVDEESAASRAVTKKAERWRDLPREEFTGKVFRFLQTRGFNFEIIRQVEAELWQSDGPDDTKMKFDS